MQRRLLLKLARAYGYVSDLKDTSLDVVRNGAVPLPSTGKRTDVDPAFGSQSHVEIEAKNIDTDLESSRSPTVVPQAVQTDLGIDSSSMDTNFCPKCS